MGDIKFGRVAKLLNEKAESNGFSIGLEAIESKTGRLVESPITNYEGPGVSFEERDILFGKLRPYLAKVWLADRSGSAVGDFHVYRARENADARYIRWVLLSRNFLDPVEASVYGAKMPRANWEDIRSILVHVPALSKQREIADFLDRETSRIDTLIAEQERFIDLLAERRISLVTETTSGVSNSQSADTQSPWYPRLPDTWRLGRIKTNAKRITDGAHISPSVTADGFDFVSTRDISNGNINFATCLKTSPETYEYMVKTGCQPKRGDILFSKDGTVGEIALVRSTHDFVVASSLVIISPDPARLDAAFLSYLLRSHPVREQADSFKRGAGLPRISVANTSRIEVPIPPLEVQVKLASFLDDETSKIDTLIAETEKFIELSRERRAALITAAVTGQIDVREEVA